MDRDSGAGAVAANAPACPAEAGDYNPRDAPQRDDPFDYYRRARQHRPVHYAPSADAWLVTRYDDICTVLNDPARFSARPGVPTPADNTAADVVSILGEGPPLGRIIINEDPPEHTQLRRIAVRAMPARRIESLRPRFHALAGELIDGFIADRAAEIVWQFCDPLAWSAVQTLIGIPRADQRQTRDWNDAMIALSLPFISTEEKCAAARGFVAYQRYIASLAEQRRVDPRDDVISDLVRIDDLPGTPLPMEDLVALVWGLSAGKNSLRDSLGTCLLALLSNRSHWERAISEPQAIPRMLEENLRCGAPLRGVFRETTEQVELGGVTLPKGSRLYVLYASGNRDETQFPNPDAFDPDRGRLGTHLGFGLGRHHCLGAPAARTVGRIAVATLTRRIPQLRLADDGTPIYLDRYFFHGLQQLEVRW